MTVAYNPRQSWAAEDAAELTPFPKWLGEDWLLPGDLCDVTENREYCHAEGAYGAMDVHGGTRILCVEHARQYFP